MVLQGKTIYIWYPQERGDLKMIHNENNVLRGDELVASRGQLKKSEYGYLYIQNEHPRGFCIK